MHKSPPTTIRQLALSSQAWSAIIAAKGTASFSFAMTSRTQAGTAGAPSKDDAANAEEGACRSCAGEAEDTGPSVMARILFRFLFPPRLPGELLESLLAEVFLALSLFLLFLAFCSGALSLSSSTYWFDFFFLGLSFLGVLLPPRFLDLWRLLPLEADSDCSS